MIGNSTCCGIREWYSFGGVNKVEDVIVELVESVNGGMTKVPVIYFSDNTLGRYAVTGRILEEYIIENKLGTVFKTGSLFNPNSHNNIIAYMWETNWDNMDRLYTKLKPVKTMLKNTAKFAVKSRLNVEEFLSSINISISQGRTGSVITGISNGESRINF